MSVNRGLRATLSRRHLVDMLLDPSVKLACVTAPAGYGKSTLVAEVANAGRPTLVVDLAEGSTSRLIIARFAAALSGDGRADIARSSLSLVVDRDYRDLLDFTLNQWLAVPPRTIVFLENAEDALRAEDTCALLKSLLSTISAGVTVAICSRVPVPFPLVRFAPPDQILRIDAPQLAFSRAEVAALCEDVANTYVESILEASRGWPMAVMLLRKLALDGTFDGAIDSLGSIHFEDLYDYLYGHVLAAYPQELVSVLVLAAALPSVDLAELSALSGLPADQIAKLTDLPFFTVETNRSVSLHPLVRTMLRKRRPHEAEFESERALAFFESREDFRRCAAIAVAMGQPVRAAEFLERMPPDILVDEISAGAEIVLKLEAGSLRKLPNLWAATVPYRQYSMRFDDALREARTAYYCMPQSANLAIRCAVGRAASATVYRSGEVEEAFAIVSELLEQTRACGGEVRAPLLALAVSMHGLQGNFSEARRLRLEFENAGYRESLAGRTFDYLDSHVAFANGEYAKGMTLIDESLRLTQRDRIPMSTGFTALNGAVFAWVYGDDTRFAQYIAIAEAAMMPGIVKGFAFELACAQGIPWDGEFGHEEPISRAIGHLYRIGHHFDPVQCRAEAILAAEEADRCRDPFVQVLAHAAVCVLYPDRMVSAATSMRDAAARIEAAPLASAVEAIVNQREHYGILHEFVMRRLLRKRVGSAISVSVLTGRVFLADQPVKLTDKETEFVMFLATHNRSVGREAIGDAVWEHLDGDAVANNVKVTVSRLRRKLGSERAIVTVAGGYALDPQIRVDLRRIEAIVRKVRGGELDDKLRSDAHDALEELAAVRPVRLGRWAWFNAFELRLRETLREVGSILGHDALAAGRKDAAMHLGRTLVNADPCDETGRELIMRAHLAEGNVVAAREELRSLRLALRADLGDEPSETLQALLAV
jgi:DNA-binding SARP family transcriptional activator